MKAVVWSEAVPADPLSALQLVDRPSPQPAAGWVKVAVRAVSLNYRDWLVVQGLYGERPSGAGPLVVASDMAGTVIETGAGVAGWNFGDRVTCSFFTGWLDGAYTPVHAATALGAGGTPGVLAEEVVLPAQALVRLPDTMAFANGAALPCAGVTAWNALFEQDGQRPGAWVAVVGTGGVATWAVQLAHAAGLRVAVVSSDQRKLDHVLALGADLGIDRIRFPAWGAEVAAKTGGADLVIDAAGASTLNESMRGARAGAQVVMVGVVAGMSAPVDTIQMIVQRLRIRGINVGSRQHLAELVRAVDATGLAPAIDSVHVLENFRDAYARLASGQHVGKIIVQLWDVDSVSTGRVSTMG